MVMMMLARCYAGWCVCVEHTCHSLMVVVSVSVRGVWGTTTTGGATIAAPSTSRICECLGDGVSACTNIHFGFLLGGLGLS